MKWYWKIAIGLLSLIVLILVLNISLNFWIKHQLPKIINKQNGSAYAITYKKLHVSLIDSNISAEEIVIVPKSALKDTLTKSGIYAKVHSLEVNHFKIWSLLFDDKIKAESISVNRPHLILFKKNEKALSDLKSIRSSVVAPFEKIISVPDIFLHHGTLKIVHAKNKRVILDVKDINLILSGIIITESILKEKIPFYFRDYSLSCHDIYYRPNQFYNIRSRSITTSKTNIKVSRFEMIPIYTRRQFVAKIPAEKDLFTLRSESLEISNIRWGFKADDFFFHSGSATFNHVAANIYRNKIPADDLTKKPLYNKLLRDLKFELKVDTLKIRNSIIEYEEEKSFDTGAGKLTFNRFNLTAMNIQSGFKQKKLKDLKIKFRCRFMNASPLNINWRFNVMDPSDGFNINGTLANLDVEKIVSFSKPYMNVSAKGLINELHFNFTGNDERNLGALAVKYDDLKFTVYQKKDEKKKNKFITFIANLLVKNDTKKRIKDAHVDLERIPEKSFYNFLWRSIVEGFKKILI